MGPECIRKGMTDARPYVLGTGDDELERLGLQSRLWGDAMLAACRRAGIRIGHRVLDVGCGPGYAAFDLARLVTSRGAVVAIDESEPFLAHLREQRETQDLPWITARLGDVQQLGPLLGDEPPFDLAYARWVLCFVPDPEAVVAGVAAALAPGGRFVVHDYFNYATLAMSPHSDAQSQAIAATVDSWHERGGDPDVVGRLPAMLQRHGFELEHIECQLRVARGTDSMYGWVDTWWHTFGPKLVAMQRLEQSTCDTLLREFADGRGNPNVIVHCPPVYEVIARKRA